MRQVAVMAITTLAASIIAAKLTNLIAARKAAAA